MEVNGAREYQRVYKPNKRASIGKHKLSTSRTHDHQPKELECFHSSKFRKINECFASQCCSSYAHTWLCFLSAGSCRGRCADRLAFSSLPTSVNRRILLLLKFSLFRRQRGSIACVGGKWAAREMTTRTETTDQALISGHGLHELSI